MTIAGSDRLTAAAAAADQRTLLLQFSRCFVDGRSAAYVSVPITTGPALLARRPGGAEKPHDYQTRLREQVVEPNLRRARPLVQAARARWPGRVVIDPTGLDDISGWTQHDYHQLWVAVIESLVTTVVFADGWQYSTGCCLEFAAAFRCGHEALDSAFRALSPASARELLLAASDELDAAGLDGAAGRHTAGLLESHGASRRG